MCFNKLFGHKMPLVKASDTPVLDFSWLFYQNYTCHHIQGFKFPMATNWLSPQQQLSWIVGHVLTTTNWHEENKCHMLLRSLKHKKNSRHILNELTRKMTHESVRFHKSQLHKWSSQSLSDVSLWRWICVLLSWISILIWYWWLLNLSISRNKFQFDPLFSISQSIHRQGNPQRFFDIPHIFQKCLVAERRWPLKTSP